MSCEIQKVATSIALGNALLSTPSAAFGAVVPPAEPILLAKMWLSWAGLLVAMAFLSKCLEEADNHHDAESVNQAINKPIITKCKCAFPIFGRGHVVYGTQDKAATIPSDFNWPLRSVRLRTYF